MDAAGELAQLLERGVELLAGAVEQRLGGLGVLAQAAARQAHVEGHRDQPLLGAVVQVALQAPALLQADAEHPLARRAQLLDLRAQLGVEALVLERQRGGRADRVDVAPLLVEQDGVVHERGDAAAVALDLGHGAAGAVAGQLDRMASASTKRSSRGSQ